MSTLITTSDLCGLIESEARGFTERLGIPAASAVRAIREKGVTASLASPSSHALQASIAYAANDIGESANSLLAKMDIYGVDSNLIDAKARTRPGARQIIVFDGLLKLVRAFAEVVTVVDRLQAERPDACLSAPGVDPEPEALAFCIAGFSALSNFMETLRPPEPLSDILGPSARGNVEVGCQLATAFILLHEAAHIELGHTRLLDVRSETSHVGLLVDEAIAPFQREEFEADRFAMELIPQESRPLFVPSLVFLLGSFAFFEAFGRGITGTHPLAVNRLNALCQIANMPEADQRIVRNWIEDRSRAFEQLAAAREHAGGSIRVRVDSSMPSHAARALLRHVKDRVRVENGLLGV